MPYIHLLLELTVPCNLEYETGTTLYNYGGS